MDGAAVSANLGVNPSLTITAQAERAMSLWPNKGDPDPRPAQGEAYARVSPVAPNTPAVPKTAYAALTIVGNRSAEGAPPSGSWGRNGWAQPTHEPAPDDEPPGAAP